MDEQNRSDDNRVVAPDFRRNGGPGGLGLRGSIASHIFAHDEPAFFSRAI
ncbi:MAG: hypothetical protein ACLP01_02700 [Solirubrobacteraceae bacterium]